MYYVKIVKVDISILYKIKGAPQKPNKNECFVKNGLFISSTMKRAVLAICMCVLAYGRAERQANGKLDRVAHKCYKYG